MSDASPWTVRKLLEWTSGFFVRKEVDSPRLSAELLLAHVLGVARIKLYTDYERPLDDGELARFRALVQRASEQEPIAYLTGKAHFFNLAFDVNRDVLIPRPDTELLVEHVVQLVRNDGKLTSPRICDLCTGSGCIAAAIAHHIKSATVLATDKSPGAVAVARANISRLKLEERVAVEEGDLFEPLDRVIDGRPFDLIVSNPPYIARAKLKTLDRSVRDYEPRMALDGGEDGLDPHRAIIAGAPRHLVPGGRLLLEIAFDQGKQALALYDGNAAYTDVKILRDYGGHDRVLAAQLA